MAARKKAVARSGKPATAPKAKLVATRAIVPAPTKVPKALKALKSESGKANGGKEKKDKKKDKDTNESANTTGKEKMVRDSFTMPAADYALIGVLKARTLASGTSVKKSELLRAGLVALAAMSPVYLIDLISAMPAVKTGRPGKKKK